jgi:putative ubiquitin-RnfH superfamily antitoxin RatB of RatAB toxin-antitoxin module
MPSVRVEVVHALADRQVVVPLQLPEGATAEQAVAMSGLAAAGLRIGIGGKAVSPTRALRDGDRVEILRPLALDPREARRRRARAVRKSRRR